VAADNSAAEPGTHWLSVDMVLFATGNFVRNWFSLPHIQIPKNQVDISASGDVTIDFKPFSILKHSIDRKSI
jgi:hypothetical protein